MPVNNLIAFRRGANLHFVEVRLPSRGDETATVGEQVVWVETNFINSPKAQGVSTFMISTSWSSSIAGEHSHDCESLGLALARNMIIAQVYWGQRPQRDESMDKTEPKGDYSEERNKGREEKGAKNGKGGNAYMANAPKDDYHPQAGQRELERWGIQISRPMFHLGLPLFQ